MDWADLLWKGFALLGMGYTLWYAGKHGWAAVGSGLSKIASVAKADFVALETRVSVLEGKTPAAPASLPAAGSSTG